MARHLTEPFYELHQSTGSPLAEEALRRIGELYAIEAEVRGRHGLAPGFTCCQDADLRNELPTLDRRIDLVFTKAQPVLVKQALVILDDPGDRTLPPPGQPRLWPSDHAGVGSVLNFWGRIRPGDA